jgi:hypothetical protein
MQGRMCEACRDANGHAPSGKGSSGKADNKVRGADMERQHSNGLGGQVAYSDRHGVGAVVERACSSSWLEHSWWVMGDAIVAETDRADRVVLSSEAFAPHSCFKLPINAADGLRIIVVLHC